MGGTDDVSNLKELTYEDHQNAHMILGKCFPTESHYFKGNIHSAQLIQKWIDYPNDELRMLISKVHKNRVVSQESINKMVQTRHKNNSWKHSPCTKRTMSLVRKGTNMGINNPRYGKQVSTETREKISKAVSGKSNGMYGRKHSTETIEKMKKSLIGKRSGWMNGRSRAVKNVETGEIYKYLGEASDTMGISYYKIRKLISSGALIYI
jgi:hypothetical protein